jgi:uncharacterized protein (DUF1778 family)
MYANRKHVRDTAIKVRFNDEEIDAINALARLSRKQRATFIYEAVLNQITLQQDIKKVS